MPKTEYTLNSATISDCGTYRYALVRVWDQSKPKVMFVMLNPSTADAHKDDPTIRRCVGFAKSWGYGGIIVCNLFPLRATDPKELLKHMKPHGIVNRITIYDLQKQVDKIICAWGNEPILKKLPEHKSVIDTLDKSKLYFIDLSKNQVPKHPLYLKSDLIPTQYIYK